MTARQRAALGRQLPNLKKSSPVVSQPQDFAVVLNRRASSLMPVVRQLQEQALHAFKWLQSKSAAKFNLKRMRVSETVSLGEKRCVSILNVDGTQFLIGAAPGQVSLLAVLDEARGTWRAGSAQELNA